MPPYIWKRTSTKNVFVAWAVWKGLVARLLKRATILGHGEFEPDTERILFAEAYTSDDGHSDTLHRTIRKGDAGKYTGLENRLAGEAIGEQAACAFHWKYTCDTPQANGNSFELNFDDWFHAIVERAGVVRGSAGRAGIPFATAHLTFRKF